MSISTLLTRDLHDVFGEDDPKRRRAAIDEIFTEECVFYDPSGGVYRGRDEIDRVANAAIADEVVQDTWLGVIRGIWAFEGRSSLKTWIFRILVNRARTRAVRESRSTPLSGALSTDDGAEPESSVGLEESALGDGSSPDRSLLTKELREKLATVIDALPANLRIVLWLRDVEGWSSGEVCNALAIQETNQRVLLHRARSRVRTALEPYFEGAAGSRRT